MTYLVRRLVLVTIGVLSALFVWPAIETLMSLQSAFGSYFWFTLSLGLVIGSVLGAFFGSTEGVLTRSVSKALWGALSGLLTGAVGAILGAFLAQSLLFAAGDQLTQAGSDKASIGLILAQASAWAVLGAAIGASEGLRSMSFKKTLLGITGGLFGGLLGGLVFIASTIHFPGFIFGRLIALILLGASISLLYSILEKRFSLGSLKVLNGQQKGKEFLVNQRRLTIGQHTRSDIVLIGYDDVAALHAQLQVKKDAVVLQARDGTVLVNEVKIDKIQLKLDDVIQIGSAKILYGYFG